MSRAWTPLLFLCAVLLGSAAALADDSAPRLSEEAPYVRTSMNVVDAMLELAGVRANDFVVDLGSGDGRIVIEAAKRFHARGLGIDHDPRLVELARERARAAGVADRVAFYAQDIFESDFSAATVVTMYLLPEYNVALKPRLLALAPGTRIVSHDWAMGDWDADAVRTIADPHKPVEARKSSTLYLWVVPARIEGCWRSRLPTARGVEEASFEFRQRYQRFTGTAAIAGRTLPLERTFLRGDALSFRVDADGETLRFQGKVSRGRIAGELLRAGGGARWRALLESARGIATSAKAGLRCTPRSADVRVDPAAGPETLRPPPLIGVAD